MQYRPVFYKSSAWWHIVGASKPEDVPRSEADAAADKAAKLREFPHNMLGVLRVTFSDTLNPTGEKTPSHPEDGEKSASDDEPSALGTGLGPALADAIPFMPSGGRRAGAASLMAQRIDQDPGLLLEHPMLSQVIASAIGGVTQEFGDSPTSRVALGMLPLALVQALKAKRIRDIQHDYDTHDRKRLREVGDMAEAAGRSVGSRRLGIVQAYDAMRRRKLRQLGSMTEAADALPIAVATSGLGLGLGTSLPITAAIDHVAASGIEKEAKAPLLTRAIGRIVTNVVDPYGYHVGTTLKRIKDQGLVNNIKAIIKDKPAYSNVYINDRDLPYRRMFGLPAHSATARRVYTKNGPGSFKFNPGDRQGIGSLEGVANDAMMHRGTVRSAGGDPVGSTYVGHDKAMGGYVGKIQPDDVVAYSDRWDFDLPRGANPVASKANMLRWVMSKITKPVMIEGRVNINNPFAKQADFTDQVNAPAIPLMLLAALATEGGDRLASKNVVAQAMAPTTPAVARQDWEGLVSASSGKDMLTAALPGLRNAMFARPRNEEDVDMMHSLIKSDPYNRVGPPSGVWLPSPIFKALLKREREQREKVRLGIAVADPEWAKPSILAHEGGHGRIAHTPGVTNFFQEKLYGHPLSRLIVPLAGAGSMAAGLASGGTLQGLLAGAGIGALAGSPKLLPEAMASMHALRALKGYQGGKYDSADARKQLLSAFASYAAGSVLPSAMAGAAGGWISGKRKAKRKAERGKKPADERKVIDISEGRRKDTTKAASSLKQTGDVLLRAARLWKARQFDLADSLVRNSPLVNAYGYKQGERFFRQHPEVVALGGHKRTPLGKLVAALSSRQPPPA